MARISILITGINGFIGQSFTKALQSESINIYGLDVTPMNNANNPYIRDFFLVDLSEKFKINKKFDYVFHLAALNQTHIGKSDYANYYQNNVIGTENLIHAVDFDCFVFMSTAKIYKLTGEKVYESSPVQPLANYEKSKLEGEISCQRNIKNKRLVIFRSVNILGYEQAKKAIIPIFFSNALNDMPIEVFAPRKSILQFLYIDDLIQAFKLIMQKKSVSGAINLSSKSNIRLDLLVRKIVIMTNSASKIIFSNNKKAIFSKIVSDKAFDLLGWEARIGIDEMLDKYYQMISDEN